MSIVNRLLKNSLSNTAAFLVEAVVAFLMMPFVIYHLGDSSYGIWVLINALTGYLGLFKLGFRPSINKHVSEYKALGDSQGMKVFMGASLHIYIYVSFLILLTAVTTSYFVPSLFSLSEEFILPFQILLLFAGVQSTFSLIGTAFGGVISGYQRYEINAGIEIAVIVIRAGLIVYFLPSFPDLYTMAAAHFSITIIGYIFTIFAARKVADVRKLPIFKKPGKEILKVILKYNSVSFSIAALSIAIGYIDSIIVGVLLPLSAITHYAVGGRLVKYCIQFLGVTTKVIAPAISELNAKNEKETLTQILLLTHKASCLVVYPILLCLFIQGGVFIDLWMGDGYQDSYQVMQVLAIATLFIAPSQAINPYLYGLGMHKYLLYILLFEFLTSVPLSIVMGNLYGAVGVALGISIPRTIMRSILLPILISKTCERNMFVPFITSQLRVLFASAPYMVLLWLSIHYNLAYSWGSFSLQLFANCSVYLGCVYLFALTAEERRQVSHTFQQIFQKIKRRRA